MILYSVLHSVNKNYWSHFVQKSIGHFFTQSLIGHKFYTFPHLLVLQFDDGLHRAVVVVDGERSHHLGALQIGDAQNNLADRLTAHQLDDL